VNQTWPRKEIIVVDDGSTDGTLSIARSFASKGVTVVAREHQGAAASRNHALGLSRGSYIQWLDADDILASDKVEKQMQAAERCRSKRTLLSGAWGRFYWRTHRARFSTTTLWQDLTPVEGVLHKMNEGAFFQTCAWLVSRELAEAVGPWHTRLLGDDDGEYFCRVMLASDAIVFVPDAVSYWRLTGVNRLSYIGFSKAKLDAHFLSMQLQIEHLRAHESSERVRAACLTCLQAEMFCFYPEAPEIVERMKAMASQLGGKLELPQISWKYEWIRKLFGWHQAKRAKLMLPNFKRDLKIQWDHVMYWFENRLRHRSPHGEVCETACKEGVAPTTAEHSTDAKAWHGVERRKADTTH